MERAWIAGKPVAFEAAIAEAARLIAASRQTLVGGLGTDIAGARAAVALAAQIGAVIDHDHSDTVLRDVAVMQMSGVMMTTPTEALVRADVLLFAGEGLGDVPNRFFAPVSGKKTQSRSSLWLCPGGAADGTKAGADIQILPGKPRDLPALIAALRAHVAGRPIGNAPVSKKLLDRAAGMLKGARFGVAIWSAAALDALTIEMLCGLVNDLNATTRFSTLPVPPPDNALGVLHVCGWMTGFPMRTGFGRGYPLHDPWLNDGRRLLRDGEADCVIWVSAYRPDAAPPSGVPVIALTAAGAPFGPPPQVHIAVGRPGVDHDCVDYRAATGTLGAVSAKQPAEFAPVADVIGRIAAALPDQGRVSC